MKYIPVNRRDKNRNKKLGKRPGSQGKKLSRWVISSRAKGKGRPAQKPKGKK